MSRARPTPAATGPRPAPKVARAGAQSPVASRGSQSSAEPLEGERFEPGSQASGIELNPANGAPLASFAGELYGEAPPTGEPPEVFHFAAQEGGVEADLVDSGKKGLQLTLRRPGEQPLKIRLTPHNGQLLGSAKLTAEEKVTVRLTRQRARLQVELGGAAHHLSVSEPQEGRLRSLTQGVFEASVQTFVQENLQHGAPGHRWLGRVVPAMKEGPGGYTFTFLNKALKEKGLTAPQGAQAALLYALRTAPDPESDGRTFESLRGNLAVLAERWSGQPVGRLLASALAEAASSSNGEDCREGLVTLLAGLVAAHELLSYQDGPEAMVAAIVQGWRTATDHARSAEWTSPELLVRCAKRELRWVLELLPFDHPLRPHLDPMLQQLEDESGAPLARLTSHALLLGSLDRWSNEGRAPVAQDLDWEGMPSISLVRAFTPMRLDAVAGRLPEVDEATWRSHAQGGVGDCYLIVSLGSIAENRPELLERFLELGLGASQTGLPRWTYQVSFELPDAHGRRTRRTVAVDDRLYVDVRTGHPIFAGGRVSGEPPKEESLWLAFVEKGYAYARVPNQPPSYEGLRGGTAAEVYQTLLGEGFARQFVPQEHTLEELEKALRSLRAASLPAAASSTTDLSIVADTPVRTKHAFVILGVEGQGEQVRVRLADMLRGRKAEPDPDKSLWNFAWQPWRQEKAAVYAARPRAGGEFTVSLEEFRRCFRRVDWCPLEPKVTQESLKAAGVKSLAEI
jgi:hypothetical protein